MHTKNKHLYFGGKRMKHKQPTSDISARWVPVIAVLAMILGALIVSMPTVMADTEPNNSFAEAEIITPGSHPGSVNATDTDDYYELVLTADGQYLAATVYVPDTVTVNLYLYNETQVEVSSNLSVTDGYGVIYHTFATVQAVYIHIQQVAGEGNYLMGVAVLDDIIRPTITHEPPVASVLVDQPIPAIIANVTDNKGVKTVRLNYTDVADENFNVTMTIVEGNYSYDIPAQSSAGTVKYFIWANDTYENENQTSEYTITVEADTEAPDITHIPIWIGIAGDAIEISADITDNAGVESATLYYRKGGETTYTSLDMTKDGDTYSATIPGEAVTVDDVEYYISATDGVNIATYPATDPTTDPEQIVIAGPIEWEIPWLWIIIAIVILVVIIVVAVVAAKRRGPSMEEEEFPPPFEEEERKE